MNFKYISLAIILFATGCDKTEGMRGETLYSKEIQSLPAEVVMTREGGGATTSNVFRVYVVSTDIGRRKIVFLADRVEDIRVYSVDGEIRISMECGRIFEYANFADIMNAEGGLVMRVPILLEGGDICGRN